MKKRGHPIPTRIIISGILLLIQLVFITVVIYDYTIASTTAYALSTVIGILTVIAIINGKGNPDHKISWIVFILLFPIFGITVFLLWGGGRILPSIKRRMIASESRYKAYLKENEEVLKSLKYHDMLHSRQAEYLIRESGYPVYNNTLSEYISPV